VKALGRELKRVEECEGPHTFRTGWTRFEQSFLLCHRRRWGCSTMVCTQTATRESRSIGSTPPAVLMHNHRIQSTEGCNLQGQAHPQGPPEKCCALLGLCRTGTVLRRAMPRSPRIRSKTVYRGESSAYRRSELARVIVCDRGEKARGNRRRC
jgi:hypothetical protein